MNAFQQIMKSNTTLLIVLLLSSMLLMLVRAEHSKLKKVLNDNKNELFI